MTDDETSNSGDESAVDTESQGTKQETEEWFEDETKESDTTEPSEESESGGARERLEAGADRAVSELDT
ncbi:MAG: hypothetical protein ACOCTH_01515, partial [Halodesulfurarchaeum sp.]